MAMIKKATASKRAGGLNNLPKSIKPATTAERVLGPNGIKSKYFEAKADVKKYPNSAQAKRQLADRSRTLSRADAILNRETAKAKLKKAAAKKADPMKTSARSHQRDLARMSGDTAGNKKFKTDKAAGKMYREDKPSPAYLAGKKAERRTLKSFK